MKLQNKRVVIIGGSSGIGFATAKAACAEGAKVIIASRSKDKLQRAQVEIGANATTKTLDVRDLKAVQSFFAEIGKFDHLVTPGASTSAGSCLELDLALAKESFESKFWGQYYAVKYGAPYINQGGSIVLFSGVLSQRPVPNTAIMASINSAVEGLARALAVELSPLRVNVISPGYVDTPVYAQMSEKDRESLFRGVADQLLVRRIGKPEEIAEAVLFLLSNGYTTGSTFFIDGGYTMR